MNVTKGIVRAVDGEDALVEILETGCGRCHEDGGCGGKADLTCRAPRRYRVDNRFGARVGDAVSIAIDDGVISRLATRAYAIPLLATVFGAMLASALGGAAYGETPAIGGALAGLTAGWCVMIRARGAGAMKARILSRN